MTGTSAVTGENHPGGSLLCIQNEQQTISAASSIGCRDSSTVTDSGFIGSIGAVPRRKSRAANQGSRNNCVTATTAATTTCGESRIGSGSATASIITAAASAATASV